MKSILSAALVVLIAFPAFAQTFTVRKVKGKQAIIVINNGSFYEGQTVTVDGGSSSFGEARPSSGGSRNNFIGLSGGINSAKSSASTSQVTTIAASVTYGWNKRTYEYGFGGSFSTMSGSNSNSTAMGLGGQFDYNFTENRPGVDQIAAAGVSGNFTNTSGSSTGGFTAMTISPNVSYKWFALGTSTAIRVAGSIDITSTSGSRSGTSTGFGINVGLHNYF